MSLFDLRAIPQVLLNKLVAKGSVGDGAVISPLSIASALLPIYLGSASTTREELSMHLGIPMRQALGGDGSPASCSAKSSPLSPAAGGGAGAGASPSPLGGCGGDGGPSDASAIASWCHAYGPSAPLSKYVSQFNALLVDEKFELLPAYKALLLPAAEKKGSSSAPLPLTNLIPITSNAGKTADAINAMVDASTKGLIKQLVTAKDVEGAVVIALNTVYLKATWARKFASSKTKANQPFTKSDGKSIVHLAMMNAADATFPYYVDGAGGQHLLMPYEGGQLTFYAYLPPPPPPSPSPSEGSGAAVGVGGGSSRLPRWESMLPALLENSGADKAAPVVASMFRPTVLDVKLPKFEHRAKYKLRDALVTSMPNAMAAADLSPMVGKNVPMVISDVIHEAVVKVDEEGTEAAAATAVMMKRCAMPCFKPPATAFIADRTFGYGILTADTYQPLFMGVFDGK